LLANGNVATVTAAAERAGLSREHLSKMLSQPHIRAFLTRKATETIRTASLRASTRLVELIDAKSEHVAAQVSERILTSEGILKSDQHAIAVNVDVKAGFILDLREEPHRTIEHAPSGEGVE
jgi:phosphoenolpyruvate carboxylase